MKRFFAVPAAAVAACVALVLPSASFADTTELFPGTAVLLNQSSGTGGGGNGGNVKVASSATNIFAPAVFVEYRTFGGEPTVTVDRYPFPGIRTEPEFQCAPGQFMCFQDIFHHSAP